MPCLNDTTPPHRQMQPAQMLLSLTTCMLLAAAGPTHASLDPAVIIRNVTSHSRYTVPAGVSFIGFVAVGPRGSDASNGFVPPNGGISAGVLAVTPGQLFHVMVGGVGAYAAVGWNGGGRARSGAGGSGATDIRTDVADLHTRLIVAGGAGGSQSNGMVGGIGGGEKGGDACASSGISPNGCLGGNQTHGGNFGNTGAGSFGQGGGCTFTFGCGGGGGWYGGSAPAEYSSCTSGGGGSGHIASSVINGTMTAGQNPSEGRMYSLHDDTRTEIQKKVQNVPPPSFSTPPHNRATLHLKQWNCVCRDMMKPNL